MARAAITDPDGYKLHMLQAMFAHTTQRVQYKTAIVAHRAHRITDSDDRITFATLSDQVSQAAAALRGIEVVHGDIVCTHLPNGLDFAVAVLACGRVGAAVNPLMSIFCERELRYMLSLSQSRVMILPRLFRGLEFEAMAHSLRPELPALKQVIVVHGEGKKNLSTYSSAGSIGCHRLILIAQLKT
jgi:cyclohexanecarboxylate-CoA ligase